MHAAPPARLVEVRHEQAPLDGDRVVHGKIADIEVIEVPDDADRGNFWEHPSVEELAQRQAVRAIERPEDLAADVWDSDAELEEFLADTYRARETGSG